MRYPGEWEPHERTIMGWPCRASLWGPTLEQARADYAHGRQRDRRLRGRDDDRRPRPRTPTRHAPPAAGRVDVVELPIDDSWLRDSGPIYVVDDSGGRLAVHFGFNAWGEKFPPWDKDAEIGGLIARELGDEVREAPMVLEGGSVISDGAGTILTTEQCLLHPNRNPSLSRERDRGAAGRAPRAPSASSGSGRAWSKTATPTGTST